MTEWIQNLGWPNQLEFITMLGMLAATYSTRVIGWLILRNREVSPRFEAVLKASPGCVMAGIVAPAFMTRDPVMLGALLVTVVLVKKTNLPVTVVGSIAAYAALRAGAAALGVV